MLFEMIDKAVTWLANPDMLVPALLACGQRHVYYGVETYYYPLIGANLIRTLRAGLAERFKPETEAAWSATYKVIQYWMIVGDTAERERRKQTGSAAHS